MVIYGTVAFDCGLSFVGLERIVGLREVMMLNARYRQEERDRRQEME